MGLFDRFKKPKNDINPEMVDKVQNMVNEVYNQFVEKQDDEFQERLNLEKVRYNRIMKYGFLKNRLTLLNSLKEANKIRLSQEAIKEIDEWLHLYETSGVNEAYRNYFLKNKALPDISLPDISFGPADVFYPKYNPFVLDDFESLLDFDNMDETKDHNLLEILLKPIKDDDELISVADGKEMEQGRKM